MQPDITAPGSFILAAFSAAATATTAPFDNRSVPYNILSGTSMACPHIAGVAALLKGAYPHWSPAAIRSAIMTTGIYVYSLLIRHIWILFTYFPFDFFESQLKDWTTPGAQLRMHHCRQQVLSTMAQVMSIRIRLEILA
jgi:hypothetical protein